MRFFFIRGFLTGGYLYFLHLSQRGRDKVCSVPLYDGTSKSAEGYLVCCQQGLSLPEDSWSPCWGRLAGQGLHEQAELPRIISGRRFFQNYYLWRGGHAARAHTNLLQKYASQKKVTKVFADNHKEAFLELYELKCQCLGKKHRNKPSSLLDEGIHPLFED